MLKNERKLNYMVGLASKINDINKSWTGIQMNFWPLVHPFHPLLYYTCLSFIKLKPNTSID